MSDALALDTYVISRPRGFSMNTPYDCYDKDGTKLFDIKKKIIGEEYSLVDSTGKLFGTMHRKMIAVAPSYDLYDGSKQLIGKAVEEINIGIVSGGKKFLLEDKDGKKIAHITITSPLAGLTELLEGQTPAAVSGYEIKSIDDSTVIARIGIQRGMIPRPGYGNFVLELVDKSISTLTLIEFAIAVDHLYSSAPAQRRSGFQMGGMPGGFGGTGGFGGGNIKIGI
jgi:hypothetical protein